MATVNVTEATFGDQVSTGIVILDWWAAWCGPCRSFAPVFEAASERHADVVFGKVDTEAEPGLAAAFGVRSIPTLMVFRDDVLVFEQAGALPSSALEALIAQARGLDMDEVRKQVAEADAQEAEAAAHANDDEDEEADEEDE